jgi:hypothetical protein
VVTLSLGSRKEMANVSSVRLTYELPQKGTRHTVPMVPIVNYLDGFGAKVPFTETGAWRLDIQVVRTGGVPAVATVRVSCCGDRQSLLSGINYILKSSTGIPIHHESEDQ